jgi:hypothetical protein
MSADPEDSQDESDARTEVLITGGGVGDIARRICAGWRPDR